MLKKIYRLSSPRIVSPRNVSNSYFSLKIGKNDFDYPRFAFVISKKLENRATVRNYLKRKLSVCVEQIFDKIKSGQDFVFYPRPESLKISQKELLEQIEGVFAKEGFIK